jgi:hypothetical protein
MLARRLSGGPGPIPKSNGDLIRTHEMQGIFHRGEAYFNWGPRIAKRIPLGPAPYPYH